MDTIFIKFLILLTLTLGAIQSVKAETYAPDFKYGISDKPDRLSDPVTACRLFWNTSEIPQLAWGTQPTAAPFSFNGDPNYTYQCSFKYTNASGYQVTAQANLLKFPICNVPATYNTTTKLCSVTCQVGTTFNASTKSCEAPPPPCTSGEVVSSGYYDGGKNPSGSFPNVSCQSGCSVIFQGTWPFSQSNQADGMHYYAKGSYVKDGFTCSGSGTSPAASSSAPKSVEQQAADAAAAQAAAEKSAKAAADKAAADAKTAADKAASAAAAQAAEAAKQAAEEAVKKAEASKAAADKAASDPNATQADKDAANTKAAADKAAADAAKQASATASGAAAAAQKDDTKPEQKDFCEKNPTSFICKTSAVNAGYCAPNGTVSGFSCDSDPVFCSMAQTQLQAYCLQNSRDEALVTAYNNMKNDTGSTNPANPANIQNINIPTTLNASSPYAGQCNPDVTISVGTTSATLPFSAWCPYLNALGYLFLAMAYMSAAVIISRT